MDVNNQSVIDFLNSYIAMKRLKQMEKLKITEIAKVSNKLEEIIENFEWELY